jgi:hypothetical protein
VAYGESSRKDPTVDSSNSCYSDVAHKTVKSNDIGGFSNSFKRSSLLSRKGSDSETFWRKIDTNNSLVALDGKTETKLALPNKR